MLSASTRASMAFMELRASGSLMEPGLHDDQRRDHLQIVLHAVIDLVGEYGLPIQRFLELGGAILDGLLETAPSRRENLDFAVLAIRHVELGGEIELAARPSPSMTGLM